MVSVEWIAKLLWYTIIVGFGEKPSHGGSLFRLQIDRQKVIKKKRKEEKKTTWSREKVSDMTSSPWIGWVKWILHLICERTHGWIWQILIISTKESCVGNYTITLLLLFTLHKWPRLLNWIAKLLWIIERIFLCLRIRHAFVFSRQRKISRNHFPRSILKQLSLNLLIHMGRR